MAFVNQFLHGNILQNSSVLLHKIQHCPNGFVVAATNSGAGQFLFFSQSKKRFGDYFFSRSEMTRLQLALDELFLLRSQIYGHGNLSVIAPL